MRESYDIIIRKLERDKELFDREIKDVIDLVDTNEYAKVTYYKAKGKKDYCDILIEFFKEIRNSL